MRNILKPATILVFLLICFMVAPVSFSQEERIPFSNWQHITSDNAASIRPLWGLDTIPVNAPLLYDLVDVVLSPTGKILITDYSNIFDNNGIMQVWDLETMTMIKSFEVADRGSIAISSDDRWFAYGDSLTNTIYLWDMVSQESVQEIFIRKHICIWFHIQPGRKMVFVS